MRITSKLVMSVRYGAIALLPGVNVVTAEQYATLCTDPNFNRHCNRGAITTETLPPNEPAPAPALAPEPVDPRAKRKGETPKQYAARMKELDEAEATAADAGRVAEADAAFLKGFFDMSDEDQAAMYGAADDREKALIDAARKAATP